MKLFNKSYLISTLFNLNYSISRALKLTLFHFVHLKNKEVFYFEIIILPFLAF